MTTQSRRSEREAAATHARECMDRPAVIRWCADRVRSTDGNCAVQEAADYLNDLADEEKTVAPLAEKNIDRPAVIRWCALQIHSMGGDYAVETAAEYLDDLATDAEEAAKCGWNPTDATPSCDWAPDCPVHGAKE